MSDQIPIVFNKGKPGAFCILSRNIDAYHSTALLHEWIAIYTPNVDWVAKRNKNTHGTECITCVDVFNSLFPKTTIMHLYFFRILPDLKAIAAHAENNTTEMFHSITTNAKKE